MKKAVARLMELSANERNRLLYEAREKEQRDNRARERGARQDERVAIAKNALKKKMSLDDITDITGLSRDEVESLCGEF
jgi:predicted transposase YdaD